MLEKSIIISAHPDDEILWFSSILDKVNEVILCFLYRKFDTKWKNPNIAIGRQKCLSEFPIKNIGCLGLDQSGVFSDYSNWQNPVITKYGIEISKKDISYKTYIENYYKLKEDLKNKLIHYRNVFTHSPWGEYGHEEHVQIYRVVRELKANLNFNLWFPNYCSNRSFHLMLKYISGFNSEYVTLKTNKALADTIKDLYKKNGCWSWYDDWEWFSEESFIKDHTSEVEKDKYGRVFPINLIKVRTAIDVKKKSNIFGYRAFKIFKKLRLN